MNKNANYAQCAHDGQLINQCDDCIKNAFIANIKSRAFELNSRNCMIIRISIDAFCARFSNMYFATQFADQIDIANMIRDEFDNQFELIIEFIEILIFG
jgi:hypothetical protein